MQTAVALHKYSMVTVAILVVVTVFTVAVVAETMIMVVIHTV